MNDTSVTVDPTRHLALYDAVPANAAALAEFGARTFFESFAADNTTEDMRRHLESAFSSEKQRREIEDPNIDTLILTDGNARWIGFAQLRAHSVSEGVPEQGSIELWRFYVDKSWHGQGVAAALMAASRAGSAIRLASLNTSVAPSTALMAAVTDWVSPRRIADDDWRATASQRVARPRSTGPDASGTRPRMSATRITPTAKEARQRLIRVVVETRRILPRLNRLPELEP